MIKINLMKYVVMVMVVFSGAATFAQEQSISPRLQSVGEFGDEMCGLVTSNPAQVIKLLPIRFAIRVALSTSVGGESELYKLVDESGMSIDDMIDMALEDSGMLDEGAGAKFFGETPESVCNWYDAAEVDCESLFTDLSKIGILNGSIQATYDALVNASVEQNMQGCGKIRVVTETEDMKLGLLMFDNVWYMAGDLNVSEKPAETAEPQEPKAE